MLQARTFTDAAINTLKSVGLHWLTVPANAPSEVLVTLLGNYYQQGVQRIFFYCTVEVLSIPEYWPSNNPETAILEYCPLRTGLTLCILLCSPRTHFTAQLLSFHRWFKKSESHLTLLALSWPCCRTERYSLRMGLWSDARCSALEKNKAAAFSPWTFFLWLLKQIMNKIRNAHGFSMLLNLSVCFAICMRGCWTVLYFG